MALDGLLGGLSLGGGGGGGGAAALGNGNGSPPRANDPSRSGPSTPIRPAATAEGPRPRYISFLTGEWARVRAAREMEMAAAVQALQLRGGNQQEEEEEEERRQR
jgi:hypothetical protein